MAFLTTCRRTTRRRVRPLAMAVRTQSWPRISSTLARVIRNTMVERCSPTVTAGRTSIRRCCPGSCAKGT